MGGLIATIMAERDAGPYQGAVVFDATLYAKEPNASVGLTLMLRIPLLFVATLREAAQAKSYLFSISSRPAPLVQPALFLISREGHTNINQPEHQAAVAGPQRVDRQGPRRPPAARREPALLRRHGPPRSRPFDGRHAPRQGASKRGSPRSTRSFGNVLLEAQAADFEAAGIGGMTFFEVRTGGNSYRTLYGRTYTDVKNGNWVAFPDADGRTVLARSYADAAGTAGLKVGDSVSLVGIEPGTAPSH